MVAHKDLCDALLVHDLPADATQLRARLAVVLGRHPLFPEEEMMIVTHLGGEIHELRDSDSNEYWSEDMYSALREAVALYQPCSATACDASLIRVAGEPLQAFSRRLTEFDWEAAVLEARRPHETPGSALYTLCSRDVALNCNRKALTVATVSDLYWPLIPPVLREVWDTVLQGRTVRLRAPAAFWEHRLSLPFRALRADLATN